MKRIIKSVILVAFTLVASVTFSVTPTTNSQDWTVHIGPDGTVTAYDDGDPCVLRIFNEQTATIEFRVAEGC